MTTGNNLLDTLARVPCLRAIMGLLLWPRNMARHADWLSRELHEETVQRLAAEDEVRRLRASNLQ